MDVFVTTILSALGSSGFMIILFKIWFETRLKASVSHEYNEKLENFREKIQKETRLYINAQNAVSEAHRASILKTLEATENIWSLTLQIGKKAASELTMVDIMTTEEFKKFFSPPSNPIEETKKINALMESLEPPFQTRLYINDYLWQLFYLYRIIVLRASAIVNMAIKNDIEWYNDDNIQNLLKIVLEPPEMNKFNNMDFGKFNWLKNTLENKILINCKKVLNGDEFGAESIRQAITIDEFIKGNKLENLK
jgi:hypothetical protein